MSFFPMMLELSGAPCLVAGGGQLGAHKAKLLLENGAAVTVVAPEICPELAALSVRMVQRTVTAEDVQGMLLVVDATGDPKARELLSAACKAKHILFNSACCADDGSAIFPAIYRQGRTVLAVSSLGASPLVSARLRDMMAAQIPDQLDRIVDAMAELRPLSRQAFSSQTQRGAFLRCCLNMMLSISRPLNEAETKAIIEEIKEKKE